LTDGLPSTDASGQAISSIPTALSDVAAVAASLHTDGVETYMIGFALPTGTNPTSLDIKYS
jgi:type IV pilus assembly protein PilY1